MLQILLISAPVYLIIALGYGAVRHGLFEQRDTRVLGRFVVHFGVPALLFRAMSSRPLAEVIDARWLLVYAVASLLVLLGSVLALRRLRGQPMTQAAIQAMGMASSNSGYVGYPIAAQLLGPPAAVGLALAMLVENLLVMPLALALAERGQRGTRSFNGFWFVLRGMPRNPMILGILAGLLVGLLQLPLPEVLARTVQIMAASATPLALFVIGGTLVGLKPDGMRGDLATIAIGKLVLHPAAVLAGLLLVPGIDPPLRSAAVVFASAPMLSIYPVLSQRYGLDKLAAAALLVATVASFLTISGWLWVLHTLPGWVA